MTNKSTQYKKGHKHPPEVEAKRQAHIPAGEKNSRWKGEKVSYRGLHYWVRRQKGVPEWCISCDRIDARFQWANIDNLYRRDVDDYVPMCSSCHKHYDIALKLASQDC